MKKREQSLNWFRLAALTAALASILFLAVGGALWHHDAPGSAATCPICYAAHLPVLRSQPLRTFVASYTVAWLVPAELLPNQAAPERLSASPRAPPA